MNKTIFALAVILALGAAQNVNAAATNSTEKFYFDVESGVVFQQDEPLHFAGRPTYKFDPGYRLDLSFGYQCTKSWAVEFQGGYSDNSFDPSLGLGGGLKQFPFLGNVIYTLPLHGPLKVYLGTGVGGVYSQLHIHFPFGFNFNRDDLTYGFQETAGLKYQFNKHWAAGLTYKFLGTTEHTFGGRSDGTMAHNVMASVAFSF